MSQIVANFSMSMTIKWWRLLDVFDVAAGPSPVPRPQVHRAAVCESPGPLPGPTQQTLTLILAETTAQGHQGALSRLYVL